MLHASSRQSALKGRLLVGLDVDHKAIGCIGRCGLLPSADQIGAQQHQQHQGQQAHRQTADLHHRKPGARRELPRGQNQPPRGGVFFHHRAQGVDRPPSHQGKNHHSSCKTAHGNQAQIQVATGSDQQHRKTQHTQYPYARAQGF